MRQFLGKSLRKALGMGTSGRSPRRSATRRVVGRGFESLEDRRVLAVSGLAITALNGVAVADAGPAAVVAPGDTVTVAFNYHSDGPNTTAKFDVNTSPTTATSGFHSKPDGTQTGETLSLVIPTDAQTGTFSAHVQVRHSSPNTVGNTSAANEVAIVEFTLTIQQQIADAAASGDFLVDVHQAALNINKQGDVVVTLSMRDTVDPATVEAFMAELSNGSYNFRLGGGDAGTKAWSESMDVTLSDDGLSIVLVFKTTDAWKDSFDLTKSQSNEDLELQVYLGEDLGWIALGSDLVKMFASPKK